MCKVAVRMLRQKDKKTVYCGKFEIRKKVLKNAVGVKPATKRKITT